MAFRARYSDAQKAALVAAILDYGLTIRHAVELANRGELPGAPADLKPFGIGYDYAADLSRAEKAKRRQQEKAAAAPEDIMRSSLGVLAERLDREVRKLQKRRKITGEEIAGLAKAGREVAALGRAVNGLPQVPTKPRKSDSNGAGDFIAGLAERDDAPAA